MRSSSLGNSLLVQVSPNLYRIVLPTPFPVGPVNVYLALGDELVLVDTGPGTDEAEAVLSQALDGLGLSFVDLDRIIISHAHADHYGLAARLIQASGATVWSHAYNRSTLEDYAQTRQERVAFYVETLTQAGVPVEVMAIIGRVFEGYGHFAQAVCLDGELADGDRVELAGQIWQVLTMPGHSGGLICLYQPEMRLLLSNDHLLRDISSNPLLEPPRPEQVERARPLVSYIDSLERTAALPVDVAWPGHGEPIIDHRELVERRLAFHRQRADKILTTLKDGPLTVYRIAQSIFTELQPADCFLAVSEVMGHLEWLETLDEVAWRDQNGQMLWIAL